MREALSNIGAAAVLGWGVMVPAWAQAPAGVAARVLSEPSLVPLDAIDSAHTSWMLVATVLVLLMTLPGIALFYAGMVRRKNVLNTMACVVVVAALVSVWWFVAGYSWAFTPGSAWIGGMDRMWMGGMDYDLKAGVVAVSHIAPHLPESVYAMFQLAFAIITAALIVGAFVERMRFSALVIFISLWTLFVYAPIAHWVWEPAGWLAQMGALDYAGGAVVHVNAGMSGLACAWVLGRRRGYGKEQFAPYNLGWTMMGAALLWIGWFGFNAGSALVADGRAGLALLVTHVAAAAGALGWMAGEWLLRGRATLLGLCSGVVAGLVAITPSAGVVTPRAALCIGVIAGLVCYWGATGLKRVLHTDDSLDVFGVHGVGGVVGSLLTGVFASKAISGVEGSVLTQAVGVSVVMIYSLVGTVVLLRMTGLMVQLRVDEASEYEGLDITEHCEQLGH